MPPDSEAVIFLGCQLYRRAGLIGGVDQVADSVDLLSDARLFTRLRALYEG